jgi:glutathione synthase/RimK-type ligase-like ATP-grasp enzyme
MRSGGLVDVFRPVGFAGNAGSLPAPIALRSQGVKKAVLIATEVLDTHAIAAEMALQDRGHLVTRLFGEDVPQKLAGSFFIADGADPVFDLSAPGLALHGQSYDVVWHRRPCGPNLPAGVLHKDDETPAAQENRHFLGGIWSYLGREAFWINPLGSRLRSTSKVLQLTEAQLAGFAVPRTLISNEPARIREFIRANQPGDTVFKAFDGHFWDTPDGGRAVNYTVKMTEASLASDTMLRTVPGIFQQQVPKAYELRVTCFGDHLVAAKLLSQAQASTALDWRVVAPAALQIEPYTLPQLVATACKQLMRRLNIVFGCFDLIVTPQGDCVFLEVNEMGQFLWIEEVNPEFTLLDTFIDFLEAKTRAFAPRPKPAGERVGFRDIAMRPEFRRRIQFDIDNHPSTGVRTVEKPDAPPRSQPAAAALAESGSTA